MARSSGLEISFVVPAHNEGHSLEKTTQALVERLKEFSSPRIIIVENGSSDRTFELAQELAAKDFDNVKVLAFQAPEKGLGFALHRGIQEALARPSSSGRHWIVLSAADLPFGFTDLDAFLSHVAADPRSVLAVGSKAHPESEIRTSFLRRCFTFAYRLARYLVLGMRTADSQGSIFIHSSWAKEIYPKIQSRDFFYSTELIALSEKSGISVQELPVRIKSDRRASTVRPFRDGLTLLGKTIALRRRLRN